jgi:hypothetical protein
MHEILLVSHNSTFCGPAPLNGAFPVSLHQSIRHTSPNQTKFELHVKVIRVFLALSADLHERDVQGNPHDGLVGAVKLDGDISGVAG